MKILRIGLFGQILVVVILTFYNFKVQLILPFSMIFYHLPPFRHLCLKPLEERPLPQNIPGYPPLISLA